MAGNKYSKLVKNTAIFAVGSFSTKILNFLIVPLYTYVLTTEEYGRIDLFTTTISFMLPIITLSIQEAMIRYILGNEIEEKTVVSDCWLVYAIGSFLSLCLYPMYKLYFGTDTMALLFTSSLLLQSFNTMFAHYLRCIGKNVAYTVKGILGTIITLLLNVVFLLGFRWGMMGYLYAGVISQVVGVVYLLTVGQLWGKLTFRYASKETLKKMISFSVPLIPNSLMWWIMSAGDKYIINYFLGDSANGLYSLALKIPTVITLFYSIFFQAWQMSAIEENSSDSRRQFYEKVFKLTNALLAGLIVCIIAGVKPLYVLVMSDRFSPAWVYVPVLCASTAFNCQASFFGVVYTTSEKTSKAFITTALGAVMNLFFNFLLIKPLGLQGVAIGTCLGYMVVCFVRANDTKKEIHMDFDITRTILAVLVVLIQCTVTIVGGNVAIAVAGGAAIIAVVILYRNEILEIFNKAVSMIRRKG